MNFRSPSVNRKTKLYRAIGRQGHVVLQGRMLVLDPSVGSDSSQPGYAIYEAGQLVDSGVIDMPTHSRLHRRLYYLSRVLREQFTEEFDVLVVEDVPTMRFSSSGRGNVRKQLPLHYAVGAIQSAVDCKLFVPITPATWHAYAPEDYVKSDESDAVMMGYAVLRVSEYASMNVGKRTKRAGAAEHVGRGRAKRGRKKA